MKARCLSLLILMVLIVYVLGNQSGFASTSDRGKTEEYSTIKISIYQDFNISLLRWDKAKEIKIYEGAIKKKALDEMEYVQDLKIQFEPGTSASVIQEVLKSLAMANNVNVIIIDSHMTVIERKRINGSKDNRP